MKPKLKCTTKCLKNEKGGQKKKDLRDKNVEEKMYFLCIKCWLF